MIKDPLLILALVLFHAVGAALHVVGAGEYAKSNKRAFLEGLSVFLLMLVAWELFAFGMMCRGYMDFWENTWGDKD